MVEKKTSKFFLWKKMRSYKCIEEDIFSVKYWILNKNKNMSIKAKWDATKKIKSKYVFSYVRTIVFSSKGKNPAKRTYKIT